MRQARTGCVGRRAERGGGAPGGAGNAARVRRAEALARVFAAGTVLAGVAFHPRAASAQYLPSYYPVNVPGYGEEAGIPVLSRPHTLYDQPGIHAGSFTIRPNLEESTGYNSNPLGATRARGSWALRTSPSVQVNSDWSRNKLGASLSLQDYRFFGVPSLNQTSWSAALGGGYTIGRHDLTLAYGHFSVQQSPTDITAPPASTSVGYEVNDFRTEYAFDAGRWLFTPNAEMSMLRYGTTTILGTPSNQSFRDRNVFQGGIATEYVSSPGRDILLVVQGVSSRFLGAQAGAASLSSNSAIALAGIDYQVSGNLLYRLLVGGEIRFFDAAQFKTHASPVAEADVVWTPTGVTTIDGTVTRTIEDPSQQASAGYTLTQARLAVAHEYRRNVVLQAHGAVELAEFLGSGVSQRQYGVGASATWRLNRNMQLTASYDHTSQNGSSNVIPVDVGISGALRPTPGVSNVNTLTTGSFNQDVFLLSIHFGL